MPRSVLASLRALVTFPLRSARVAEFVFRRRDAGGDLYPEDASNGIVEGCDPDRVLFLGELGELTLGVRTHELSLPAFFARRRAAATGKGVAWSIASVPSSSVRGAAAVVVEQGDRLAGCDRVVILLGISDALRVISPFAWEASLRETFDVLLQGLPRGGSILVGEIPPLDNAASLSAPARLAAGIHGRILNARTHALAEDYASVDVVNFPEELTRSVWRPESEEHRYRDTYKVWGAHLADAIN
jgi:hypothetical protein